MSVVPCEMEMEIAGNPVILDKQTSQGCCISFPSLYLRDELPRPRRPLLNHDRHQVRERELETREAQLAGELVLLAGLHVAEGLHEDT